MTDISSHAAIGTSPAVRERWVRQHPIITYFGLAYLISWSIEIPLALHALPRQLHYLAAYGPLLAAIITTALADGRAGLRELGTRMVRWRVSPGWWVAAVSPLGLYALTALLLRLIRGGWTNFDLLGRVNFLPDLGVGALGLWLLTYGLGEETGWRGFALPRLQRHHTALGATLILSAFWILWHIPTLFYLPTYAQLGLRVLPMFALGIVAGAICFTWLYNGSSGSILLAAVGHATLNYVTASPVGEPVVAAVVSTVIMVWAVVVIMVWKPATLSPAAKAT